MEKYLRTRHLFFDIREAYILKVVDQTAWNSEGAKGQASCESSR